MEVVHWLRQQLGFEVPAQYTRSNQIGGILTLGGCLSNTVALMAAREFVFPGSSMTGLGASPANIRVLVPDVIEHYSIRAAMSWLGMGEKHVVRIPVDSEYRVKLDDLDLIIDQERWKGHHILAFVCYAGDSRSMRIDRLDAIAELLQKKQVWMHVDACHGSQLAFPRKHRYKLAGIDRADSVTIDPHKVLWIPNTCSFVLFKDPASLAKISTNSDLILKTQWSLGQITPCIGSKAFDSLELWSTIKFLGQNKIERLIDERLDLTAQIQAAIEDEPDLVLLNKTDINSCMLMFVPQQSQSVARRHDIKFSAADCEKLRAINYVIYKHISGDGQWYLHGFNIKRCPYVLFEEDTPMYVLRTMNGNPLTKITNVRALLDAIVAKGRELVLQKEYRVLETLPTGVTTLPASTKLKAFIGDLLGDYQYQAVVYGSGASDDNMLLSDIDLMVFVDDDFERTPERLQAFEDAFREIILSEGVQIDAEVPYQRKLLIPLSFAEAAATGACIRQVDGDVAPIEKSTQYLSSDEMIARLTFNVLTVPHRHLCGSPTFTERAKHVAAASLVRIIDQVRDSRQALSCDAFVQRAMSDGKGREGEGYLGYKQRPEVIAQLETIWKNAHGVAGIKYRAMSISRPKGCLVLLNGFPGTGKLAIARALRSKLRDVDSRLIDNHLIIDPAEAIHPGRGSAHKTLRNRLRQVVLDELRVLPNPDTLLIVTLCLGANEEDAAVFAEHVDIARARDIPCYAFTISCDKKEHMLRLQSPDRAWGDKRKLSEPAVLDAMLSDHKILDPTDRSSGYRFDIDVQLQHSLIDTTDLSLEESALRVLDGITPRTSGKQMSADV